MTDYTDRRLLDDSTEPDIILPGQLTGDVAMLDEPERRLRLAVLEDAIRYVQRYLHATDKHGRALYEDAVDWFGSPDRGDPFAFENVCDALGLDPDYIRGGLRRWRDTEARRPSGSRPRPTDAGVRRSGRDGRTHRRAA